MFTDIVNSTKLKGEMPGVTSLERDQEFKTQIKDPHDRIILGCVRQAGGYKINPTGDGYFISFQDAEKAVLCALRIQKELLAAAIQTPHGPLEVRIGLHTGQAEWRSGDYIGSTPDKAARVQSKANGGQVFASQQTYILVKGKIRGIAFKPAGTYELKGLAPEDLYQAIEADSQQDLEDMVRVELDPSAREALRQARCEAERMSSASIGGRHLLLGLLASENSLLTRVLERIARGKAKEVAEVARRSLNMGRPAAGLLQQNGRLKAVIRAAELLVDRAHPSQGAQEFALLTEGDLIRALLELAGNVKKVFAHCNLEPSQCLEAIREADKHESSLWHSPVLPTEQSHLEKGQHGTATFTSLDTRNDRENVGLVSPLSDGVERSTLQEQKGT
jgi:class 3 adenylate cyclase